MCHGTLESTLVGCNKRLVDVCNKARQGLNFKISLGAKFPHEIKSIKDSSQKGFGKRTWEDSKVPNPEQKRNEKFNPRKRHFIIVVELTIISIEIKAMKDFYD